MENEPEVPTFNPTAGTIGTKPAAAAPKKEAELVVEVEEVTEEPETLIEDFASAVEELNPDANENPYFTLPAPKTLDPEFKANFTVRLNAGHRVDTDTTPDIEPVEIVDLTGPEHAPTEPIQTVDTDINFIADQTQEITQETLENLPVDTPSKPLDMPEIDPNEALIPGEEKPNPGPIAIFKETGIFFTLMWAVGIAAASGGAAYMFARPALIPVAILGFLIGIIAAIDIKTHLIKDMHTVIIAAISIPLTVWYALTAGSAWNLLWGAGIAAIIFGVFLFLVWFTGFGSGGDIKFSPIPAFILGTINPLIGIIWFFISLLITALALSLSRKKQTAFGLGMALALPTSIAVTYYLYQLAGMGMM